MRRAILPLLTCSAFLLACGGGKKEAQPPVATLGAADEVLRIGDVWTSIQPEKGILSPPSKVSLFRTHRKSQLRISESRIMETLTIEEEAQLREGPQIKCRTVFEHELGHKWGRRQGEAAVELVRPALSAPRSCDIPHPDGPIAEPARRALFVLRSDTLVAVEPVVDQRTYISGQM
jgi:hypothetical protein